jgi:hypothetical protein
VELIFKNSFFRDLDNIGSRAPKKEIEKLILKISPARTISTIPGIKQLHRTKQFEYKIELKVQTKVYWILCDVYSDKIELIRIKSETWCKDNL